LRRGGRTSSASGETWRPPAGARATIARRLCTIAGFYRYAVEEELLEHSPAVHVRRPRLDYESHAVGLDRNEVGALLVAAGLGAPAEHALISLLAINGLRISEAMGADIDALGIERGHRTLTVLRKGGKIVTIPLAPRTARAIDLAIGERRDGPIFLRPDGQRMDRHCAAPHRAASRAPGRAGQEDQPTHPPPRLHHRRPRRRRPPQGCAGSRLPRRPENHHALRPSPRLPRPPRHLHRRRLPRRRRPITTTHSGRPRLRGAGARHALKPSLCVAACAVSPAQMSHSRAVRTGAIAEISDHQVARWRSWLGPLSSWLRLRSTAGTSRLWPSFIGAHLTLR
jgi:hypothetical protein